MAIYFVTAFGKMEVVCSCRYIYKTKFLGVIASSFSILIGWLYDLWNAGSGATRCSQSHWKTHRCVSFLSCFIFYVSLSIGYFHCMYHFLHVSILPKRRKKWITYTYCLYLIEYNNIYSWLVNNSKHGPACIAFHCSHLYITIDITIIYISYIDGSNGRLYMQAHNSK